MICPNCATENEAGARFCMECATPLGQICPSCGKANQPSAKFCSECATPLGSAPGATAVAGASRGGPASAESETAANGPVAERRLVSVLFADLVGFTPFAEERDAEDVRDTLSRYFELATDVVTRYGGTIEKFIGDAVMAVWGTPVAHEDDAERAVRAALELASGVTQLGAGIQARVGVMTGEAAVTLGASNQGMVAGDLVNTAARLQAAAAGGSVLVGEGTMRAASSAVAFEPVGEQDLKGKASPVPAWRALRIVAQRRGQGRSDIPEPPFTGRDEELRVLKELITATGRDPRARLVSIVGPAGIGKSRLAWELEKYIDGVVEAIYWHRGRSPSYGEGVSFWALGEMVRRRAGLAESDDDATTRARVATMVAEFVPDADDRTWVEPAMLTLLGLEPAPAGGRDVLFAAWRIFFERVAAKGTTVLLFEDIQWADSGLLEFIDHVLEWSKGAPILIVTLARPELFDRQPGWGAGARNFTAITLEPLPEPAMRQLLAGFVPGLPQSAADAILARADGIPLYAVETVRALMAEERLELIDGTYRPRGDLGALTIPDTLRSLIASRLDALEPADRALVADAAVLGQSFTLPALASVSGRDEPDLQARLRALVRRELLRQEADPRSPERGQYAFVQGLIREVAYGTLAKRERRALHLAAARFYEALGDDELAGALASHYLSAYEASATGPESEAIGIQARLALSAAAERAATLGAHAQAVAYLRQALAVTSDAAERAPLLERAATSASAVRFEDAEKLAQEAIAAYRSAGDEAGVAMATALLGAVLMDGGAIARAVETLEAALASTSDEVPVDAKARLLANLSRAVMRDAQWPRAIEVADQALALAEPADLIGVVADAFNNKGGALRSLGRGREAAALMQAAIDLAHAGGFVDAELRARNNLASVLFDQDMVGAREIAREALALAERLGHRGMAHWAAGLVVGLSSSIGDGWDEALAIADEAMASPLGAADEARTLSVSWLIRGARGEEGAEALRRLEALAAETGQDGELATVKATRAKLAFAAGDAAEARDLYVAAADEYQSLEGVWLTEAGHAAAVAGDAAPLRRIGERLDAYGEANLPWYRAQRASLSAALRALEGDAGQATQRYREALRRFADLGLWMDRAQTAAEAALLLGTSDPEIAPAADEAEVLFKQLGARPYLELLRRANRATDEPQKARDAVTVT
jgi:class 3 adenylate cyclase/tetratricopeptide (TPR) repeat protein